MSMVHLTFEEFVCSLTAEAESYCQSRPKDLKCLQQQVCPLDHTACCDLRLLSGSTDLNMLSGMQL